MYNLTNFTEANNPYTMFVAINNISGGLFGGLFLLVIFIMCFVMFKNYDTKSVFIVSSFITSLLGFLFLTLGFISWIIFIFPILLLMASILTKIFTEG